MMTEPLLRVEGPDQDISQVGGGLLARKRSVVHAVDNVSFDIAAGETLGPGRRIRLAASRPPGAASCA